MEIGIIGSALIMAAWLYEAYHTYKKGEKLDTKFLGIYIVGLSLLTYYSYQIDDKVFLVLNGSILALTIAELVLSATKR
jgi:lipid-A-disaccharide synthase-like uncharacterized protein